MSRGRWEGSGASALGASARASATAGRKTEKVLPRPSSLCTSMRPPWALTMSAQMESPSPLPSLLRRVEKKGSKIRARTAGGMPTPSSMTSTRTKPPSTRVRTRRVWSARSSGMACAAFTKRLRNTWQSRPSMPRTRGSGA